jgi:nucleoid DNA-binding protein
MNKKTLLNKVTYKSTLNKETCEKIFDRMFEMLREKINEDRSFEIEEFGKFEVLHKHMSKEYDTSRKVDVLLPPKDKILFTPSPVILGKINHNGE